MRELQLVVMQCTHPSKLVVRPELYMHSSTVASLERLALLLGDNHSLKVLVGGRSDAGDITNARISWDERRTNDGLEKKRRQ